MDAAARRQGSAARTGPPPVDALVARAQKGDADAFGELYVRYQPEIARFIAYQLRDTTAAEDLTQQVFLKAWQAIPRYRQQGAPFRAWLYRMARNQVIDHFRASRPTTDLEGVEVAEPPEAERRVLAIEMNEQLRAALDRLTPDHRQVLVLRFLMERSAAETGEIMGRREVTVRGLQMRALRALRSEIAAMGGLP